MLRFYSQYSELKNGTPVLQQIMRASVKMEQNVFELVKVLVIENEVGIFSKAWFTTFYYGVTGNNGFLERLLILYIQMNRCVKIQSIPISYLFQCQNLDSPYRSFYSSKLTSQL